MFSLQNQGLDRPAPPFSTAVNKQGGEKNDQMFHGCGWVGFDALETAGILA